MPFKRVHGVVGGADDLNAGACDKPTDAHVRLCKLLVAKLPNLLGGAAVEHSVIAEITLKLKVAPVQKRIAHSLSENLRPFLELFTVRSVSGDVFLVNSGRAHQTPLVVVASQPYLRDVVETSVLRDLTGYHPVIFKAAFRDLMDCLFHFVNASDMRLDEPLALLAGIQPGSLHRVTEALKLVPAAV